MSRAAPGGRARPGERDWTRVRRARVHPPAEIYPVDPWRMRATSPPPEMLAQMSYLLAASVAASGDMMSTRCCSTGK